MESRGRGPTTDRFPGWIAFVARRYFRARRSETARASSLLSTLGIVIGVTALVAVLGVMNGFQMGFIESILEIGSYHLRLESGPSASLADAGYRERVLGEVRGTRGVASAVPFIEIQSLIRGKTSALAGCAIRALPADAFAADPGFASRIRAISGDLAIGEGGTILIGRELARNLGCAAGDTVSVVTVPERKGGGIVPISRGFVVTGIFKSGYLDYDSALAFVDLRDGELLYGENPDYVIGAKLADRYADERAVSLLSGNAALSGLGIESWRHYNRAFFGALRTEKTMMMILIGIIFFVVGINIYHSLKRSIFEKREEIGLLLAVGASRRSVSMVFVVTGALIGGSGATAGLLLGLFISANINAVLAFAELAVNFVMAFTGGIASLVSGKGGMGGGDFSLFSPVYFYLSGVESRVPFAEALVIFLFALLSAAGAAYFASKRASDIEPAKALRYE